MARKYYIDTFGCQMNVHDSERLAGLLDQAGYEPATTPNEADLVVINTCSVRERAEDRLYTELGMVATNKSGKRPIVAVTGCVGDTAPNHPDDLILPTLFFLLQALNSCSSLFQEWH